MAELLFFEQLLFVLEVQQLFDDRPACRRLPAESKLGSFRARCRHLDAAVRSLFFDSLYDNGRNVMRMDIDRHGSSCFSFEGFSKPRPYGFT
jgi:hypothetical protein